MIRFFKIIKVFFILKYKEFLSMVISIFKTLKNVNILELLSWIFSGVIFFFLCLLFTIIFVNVILPILALPLFFILPNIVYYDIMSIEQLFGLFILLGLVSTFVYILLFFILHRLYKFIKSNIKEAIYIVDNESEEV